MIQVNNFSSGSGFGFKRNKSGELKRNQHPFAVIFGEDVEVGRFTNIDRGSWRSTSVGKGTKIDSLVHIGHNVIIGRHCLLVSGCVIGGSTEIGDYSYIGENACIRQHLKIGHHVIIGQGAVVINDIPDYDIVAGNIAKSIKGKVNLTDEERFRMVGY